MNPKTSRGRRVAVPSLLGDAVPPGKKPERDRRRFLFAVPPLTGHVNPTVAVAAELTARGHRVAWVGRRGFLEPLLPSGARVYASEDTAFAAKLEAARDEWTALRGPAALKFLWEEFIVPLGHAMMPGVERAMDRFHPDVVVSDQQVLAAPVAARLRGLPWATSATTSAEFTRPLAGMPLVEEWVRDRIGGFQAAHDIEDLIDLRFSDHLTLVFSTGALVGDVSFFPDHIAFVGPALGGRPERDPFPFERLDPEGDGARPAVLVTLGTVSGPAGARFFRVAAEAVADLNVQAVFVMPSGKRRGAGPAVPDNVIVRESVPQLALLPRMSAVVAHGGHNTVCEALAHGLPLVVAPIRDDQPVIARQVEASGAGRVVRFARVSADELRTALTGVLTDPAHREAAARVRDSFDAAGGAARAADLLEKLA
ncbi:glycosyltransferase [Actinomadura harenae]|uniref:Glycosyltransferase n=1 Tax=Actinomadura harenae TaxID=2483351 RepID=A0A3M2L965_9ACTN|nr:nucleotide disphospho-sugar-binding domain-containing protein [Actinomadura harenae]RMI31088.1 glycosyltransferase [Actinomadura harenae]